MVVDVLVEAPEPRHHDGPLAVREREHDRPDARVRDDHPRPAHELDHLVEGQVVELRRPVASDGRGPVLDDELLVGAELSDCTEKAIERRLVRSDGDEDHRGAKTFPA